MRLKMRYYDDPILRKRCQEIKEITPEIRQLALDMIETMDALQAAGLAAPQVGHSVRLFVLRSYIFDAEGKWTQSEPKVYINPKLSNPSEEFVMDDEGCLSFPGLRIDIERPDRISVEAMDLEGNLFVEQLEGYNARLRMHENDHLNGVLFIDRLKPNARKKVESLLRSIKEKHSTSSLHKRKRS